MTPTDLFPVSLTLARADRANRTSRFLWGCATAQPLPLTADESATLAESERVIESGLKTFIEVGSALLKIRDTFKGNFPSIGYADFETYCRERWDLEKSRVYQLIDASKVATNLSTSTVVELLPSAESQTRPLAPLSPEQQREAWTDAIERTGGTIMHFIPLRTPVACGYGRDDGHTLYNYRCFSLISVCPSKCMKTPILIIAFVACCGSRGFAQMPLPQDGRSLGEQLSVDPMYQQMLKKQLGDAQEEAQLKQRTHDDAASKQTQVENERAELRRLDALYPGRPRSHPTPDYRAMAKINPAMGDIFAAEIAAQIHQELLQARKRAASIEAGGQEQMPGPVATGKEHHWLSDQIHADPPGQNDSSGGHGQAAAVKKYPALGVADSALNREFLARVKMYRASQPALFQDPGMADENCR